MNARIKSLIDRQIVAPSRLWMIGVPLDEVVSPSAVTAEAEGRGGIADPAREECRCPESCGRDHPNE